MKRTALVTGAARGLGLAIAERMAREGHRVFMLDVMNDELNKAAQPLLDSGFAVVPLQIDLASDEEISALPARIGDDFEDVSILINNAGIAPVGPDGRRIPAQELPLEQWERVLRINLTAPFRLMQLCIPSMQRQKWGRIVNVSSRAGRSPGGTSGADYVTTKSGILGLTRAFAMDVGPSGITVNSIAPGRLETDMGMSSNQDVLNEVRARTPVGRFGEPSEVASLVSYLVGEEAGYITGAVIDINGGILMI